MIVREIDVTVKKDAEGIYFQSDLVNLEKESLVVPIKFKGMFGTAEFKKREIIFHPANGDSLVMTERVMECYLKFD